MQVANCKQCGGVLNGDGEVCPKCLLGLGVATQMESMLKPGTMFHGLEIISKLGRGGMGVVYKARQPHLDRFVAVKVLLPSSKNKELFAQRFSREAKALAALSHPNIVTVHDFGQEEDQYFLVMEYVDGATLRALLSQKRLSPKEALRIVPILCDALEYAHKQGVVHRDIKPENILIDRSGQIKVADFGLAKLTSTDTPNLTQTDVVMGTPHYMAPEQFQGAKEVDHRADIYSMGVLFYEMLTGELPLGRFAMPSTCKVEVDVRLDEVVLRALEKEPTKRYQSMSDVRRDLAQIASSPPKPRKSGVEYFVGAGLAAIVLFFLYCQYAPPGAPAAANKSDAPAAAAAAVAPNTTVQPAPAKIPIASDWELAVMTQADLPADWHLGDEPESGEGRMDVLKAAQWWGMGEHADGIEKFRRFTAKGPKDREIGFYAYQCRDQAALGKCLADLARLYLPYPNRTLLEKGNAFVLISAKDNHDGYVSPAFEFVVDRAREKLALPPAKRIDHSAVKAEFLPPKWTELKAGDGVSPLVAKKREELPGLQAALGALPLPPLEEARDGWAKWYGDPAEKGVSAKVVSVRFFELDPAKLFAQHARTAEPPEGQEMAVLRDSNQVVVLTFSSREPAKTAAFEFLKEQLTKSIGTGSDQFRIEARALPKKEDNGHLAVPLEISGINARELSRAGKWAIQIWHRDDDAKFQIPPPADFTVADGKLKGTLVLPDTPDAKAVIEKARVNLLNIAIDWNLKNENRIDVQVNMVEK